MHESAKSRGLVPSEVQTVQLSDLNHKEFYRDYVLKSTPLLIQEMTLEWPAHLLWN